MPPKQELGSGVGELVKNSKRQHLNHRWKKYLKLIRWEDGLLLEGLLLVLEHCATMGWDCLMRLELLKRLSLSAIAISRTPVLMNFMMRGSLVTIGMTFAAMIGAGMLVRSIPYDQSPGPKHLAWLLHSGVMGAVVAPLTILGGPLLIRAAWYTAGIVGGLSTVAMCAPSEKFLDMGAPLGVGLGFVFVSSLGSMFLPPTTVAGATLYSVAMYGGLVLFSMFLLYDTQKVIKRAEVLPAYGVQKYDPINSMLNIYMDTLNIFIRVATMLATGSNRKK
ncbi:PREDICTED: growth hormone-inducible transmembrane protein isoform X2 [Colobus angolensis palliatus]|uniref:growth hormone-inducible transmembrane protein isoform X2 n=1 Tax=Colobus angolensis palliatus TaxID=336983 RepID=UPI0005F3AFD9|nr:PREDICTED: growth hormone-inducible transmembrane protein isoform X2 [Colobus angolensis palliatus]